MVLIGQRYDLFTEAETWLSVQFFNDCVHKEDGRSFGRLEGLRRDAMAKELQGKL